MTAHERPARREDSLGGADDAGLRRADVRDDHPLMQRRGQRAKILLERPDGSSQDHQVGPIDGLGDVKVRRVNCPDPQGFIQTALPPAHARDSHARVMCLQRQGGRATQQAHTHNRHLLESVPGHFFGQSLSHGRGRVNRLQVVANAGACLQGNKSGQFYRAELADITNVR